MYYTSTYLAEPGWMSDEATFRRPDGMRALVQQCRSRRVCPADGTVDAAPGPPSKLALSLRSQLQ